MPATTLPVGWVSVLLGLLLLGCLTGIQAQQGAPSGEELYVDRLGCWNCHGASGGGGDGPAIDGTRLPLRDFLHYVRLPSGSMPPVSPILASDAELVILYRWLDGVDAATTPPSITVSLKADVPARGQAKAIEVEVTTLKADVNLMSDVPDSSSLWYRVTLRTEANAPVANHPCQYQAAGRQDWSEFTTDQQGETLLGPDRGFMSADAQDVRKKRAIGRLRTALAPGRHTLVIEAIDLTIPATPVVVGVGTTVFGVE